jgi:hypothetical protein
MAKKKPEELSEKEIAKVKADSVTLNRCRVKSLEGKNVRVQQTCALSVDAETIENRHGISGVLNGENIDIGQSCTLAAAGQKTTQNFSISYVTAAEQAEMNSSAACVVASKEVRMIDSTAVLVLANRVEGNINTLFDWRSALSLGAVMGGILGLFSLLRRG